MACNICNGDEKREMPWRGFLEYKCKDLASEAYLERLLHIERWHSKSNTTQLDSAVAKQIHDILEQAKANFDESVKQMRELRDSIKK